MTDPPRLRDLSDGDAWSRQLLREAPKSAALTPADYARLGARVPHTLAGASTGLAGVVPVKALALLGALTLGAAGAVALRPRAPSSTIPVATRVIPAAPALPRPPEPAAAPLAPPPTAVAEPAAVTAPTETAPTETASLEAPRAAHTRPATARTRVLTPAPDTAPAAPSEPTLAEELQVLDAARAQMHTDPAGAAALLRDARGAQLRDERDALRAESLARAGQRDEARAVAAALTARAPQSPQSARVRALLGEHP